MEWQELVCMALGWYVGDSFCDTIWGRSSKVSSNLEVPISLMTVALITIARSL